MGLSSHPCLPLLTPTSVQQGSFAPRALPRFIATASPAATVSSSADFPGSPVIRPTWLRRFLGRDEDGFSSCSTCPCHRATRNHPAGVASRLGQPAARHAAFAPHQRARPPVFNFLSRPPLGSLALRPGDSLTIPKMASSVGFIRFVSSTDATQATKVPDFFLRWDCLPPNMSAFSGHTPYQKLGTPCGD